MEGTRNSSAGTAPTVEVGARLLKDWKRDVAQWRDRKDGPSRVPVNEKGGGQ